MRTYTAGNNPEASCAGKSTKKQKHHKKSHEQGRNIVKYSRPLSLMVENELIGEVLNKDMFPLGDREDVRIAGMYVQPGKYTS